MSASGMKTSPYRVKPGQPVDLGHWTTDDNGGPSKGAARPLLQEPQQQLAELQERPVC